MKTLLLAALLTMASGCATENKFRERMDSWIGENADKLIEQFGPPQNQATLSTGEKVLVWTSGRGVACYGAFCTTLGCKTQFTADNENIVRRYSYAGNSCKSN